MFSQPKHPARDTALGVNTRYDVYSYRRCIEATDMQVSRIVNSCNTSYAKHVRCWHS